MCLNISKQTIDLLSLYICLQCFSFVSVHQNEQTWNSKHGFVRVLLCLLQLIDAYWRALKTSQMDSQNHHQKAKTIQLFNLHQQFTSCIIFYMYNNALNYTSIKGRPSTNDCVVLSSLMKHKIKTKNFKKESINNKEHIVINIHFIHRFLIY